MFSDTIISLMQEYGTDIKVETAYHLHDEDEDNKYMITYKGIIVGSELVGYCTIRNYIEHIRARMR